MSLLGQPLIAISHAGQAVSVRNARRFRRQRLAHLRRSADGGRACRRSVDRLRFAHDERRPRAGLDAMNTGYADTDTEVASEGCRVHADRDLRLLRLNAAYEDRAGCVLPPRIATYVGERVPPCAESVTVILNGAP